MTKIESELISQNTRLWKTWEPPQDRPDVANIVNAIRLKQLLSILGPCGVQSLAQMLAILEITAPNSKVARGPDKKPRERPVDSKGNLLPAGIGHEKARPIYIEVRNKYPRLALAAEVMVSDDFSAIGDLIGLPWSGSRTQEAPTMRALGKAAAERQLPLMIKNPMFDNTNHLVGMIENAILGMGDNPVPILVARRGIYPDRTERKTCRNIDNVQTQQDLQESFPDLPIIIDPSHMPLKTDENPLPKIITTVRQALDMGAIGYMIEVNHPDHPSWTDPGVNAACLVNALIRNNLN